MTEKLKKIGTREIDALWIFSAKVEYDGKKEKWLFLLDPCDFNEAAKLIEDFFDEEGWGKDESDHPILLSLKWVTNTIYGNIHSGEQ